MNSASMDIQSALSVASCFGTKVTAEVIKALSLTGGRFAELQIAIDRAVQEGYIDFDGTCYRFAHDIVRGSACEISQEERHTLHFQIGLALLSSYSNQNEDTEMLFTMVEQINYGVPLSLNSDSQRISIAMLNYRAGLVSLKRWNYVGALTYLKAARSLLGVWSEHYQLNLDVHYQLAKAAYSCGDIVMAKNTLDEITSKGKNLEDKLNAYDLFVVILQHRQEVLHLDIALNTCCKILKMLGEKVANESEMSTISQIIELGRAVCRHTPICLVWYSGLLVHGFSERNCTEAHRLGKIALKLLNESEDQNEVAGTYCVYYGFVGILYEPIQACVDMLRKGYEIGIQMGCTNEAFCNLYFLIPRMIEAGTNLDVIRKEIVFFQKMATTHSHPVLATYMKWYQDTIILLCDEEPRSSVAMTPVSQCDCSITDATIIHLIQLLMPATYLVSINSLVDNSVLRSLVNLLFASLPLYFKGQYERVEFLVKKWDKLDSDQKGRMPWRNVLISFYYALALAGMYRRKTIKKYISCMNEW
eukprot:scaffold41388_cov125-Cyclotella_meneghiniana.AAC.6